MRLGQVSNLRGFQRGAAALAKILLVSKFLRYWDERSAWEEDATSFRYRTKEGSITAKARAIGGSVVPDTLEPAPDRNGSLYNHYFALDIDESHIADSERGLLNLGGWIETELPEEIDSFTRGFEAKIFRGTGSGTPAELKGFFSILDGVTALTGFSITGVINAKDAAASGNSLDLTDSANYERFEEAFSGNWVTQVEDCDAAICSPRMGGKLSAIAKKLNMFHTAPDQFGRMIDHFGPCKIITTLDTSILHTEPDDAGTPVNNTTSILLVSPGEQRVSMVTNSGLDYREPDLEAKQSGRIIGEVRSAIKIQKKNVIRRIRNIKA